MVLVVVLWCWWWWRQRRRRVDAINAAAFCNILEVLKFNLFNLRQQKLQHRFVIRKVKTEKTNHLFLRANAAQQRHNVGFVPVDGAFERGLAVSAGSR
jgi:hypothetical protein